MLSEGKQRSALEAATASRALGGLPLVLVATLLFGAGPADASEVVKLARLVITGQRLHAERSPAMEQRIEQLPLVVINGQRSEDGVKLAAQPRGQFRAL